VTQTSPIAAARPSGLGWPDPPAGPADADLPGRPSGRGWPDQTAQNLRVVSRETSADAPTAVIPSQDPTVATVDPVAPKTVAGAGSVLVGPMVDLTTPAGGRPAEVSLADPTEVAQSRAQAPDAPELATQRAPLALGADVPIAEEFSVMDQVSRETEDTPIARAAETAVRVLAGRVGDPLPRPPQTRVMTVANQKGGVGKTTTTVNLAAALALQGLNVLVVDLDPQGNASTALGVDHHSEVPSIYDVLIGGRPVHEVVAPVDGIPGLWCVPATIHLAGAEIELVPMVARESRLGKALTGYLAWCAEQQSTDLPRLDYVLIDCPPSLGLLTVNALVASPEVLIPVQCEYYALEGVGQLLSNIEMVKAHLNPGLHVSTVLLTMYDARTRLAAQVAQEVRTHFATTVLRTTIPRSVRISEAPSYGQTVMTYDPGSTGALSYLEAAREMAVRGAEDRTATVEETA
jgi:chromosome partitioning protein